MHKIKISTKKELKKSFLDGIITAVGFLCISLLIRFVYKIMFL